MLNITGDKRHIDRSFFFNFLLFVFLCSLLTFLALLQYNKVYEFGFDVAISIKLGIRFIALFDTRKTCLWLFSLTWLVRTEILQRRFQYFSETWINYRKPGNRKKKEELTRLRHDIWKISLRTKLVSLRNTLIKLISVKYQTQIKD